MSKISHAYYKSEYFWECLSDICHYTMQRFCALQPSTPSLLCGLFGTNNEYLQYNTVWDLKFLLQWIFKTIVSDVHRAVW
jgi:hypothetical protein